MLPLMRRIANEIADKVALEVNVKAIFRREPQEAAGVIGEVGLSCVCVRVYIVRVCVCCACVCMLCLCAHLACIHQGAADIVHRLCGIIICVVFLFVACQSLWLLAFFSAHRQRKYWMRGIPRTWKCGRRLSRVALTIGEFTSPSHCSVFVTIKGTVIFVVVQHGCVC